MLNFIYYPVSAIMWFWHKAFGYVFGEATAAAWVLSVVFLVFTLRALLYKPFVSQVRSMRKMQEFAPEIQKLKKKYGNDRQKMAAETQKLQAEHGFNPLAGCLPILVQVPVFIGLFQVLREFNPGDTQNYVFGESEVASFIEADLFGANLGATIFPSFSGGQEMAAYGTSLTPMLIVMIPLMIVAGVLTHITARHSVARQQAAQAENPQTAIMNKLMLYVFPIGVVVGAPFLPLAVLIYWVANNLWTLAQQFVVYKRIDAEEATKREQAVAGRQARAPRPGQKPSRPGTDTDTDTDTDTGTDADAGAGAASDAGGDTEEAPEKPEKTPGAKPVSPRTAKPRTPKTGSTKKGTPPRSANGSAPDGSGANVAGPAGTGANGSNPAKGRAGGRSGGGSRPPARRGRKRR